MTCFEWNARFFLKVWLTILIFFSLSDIQAQLPAAEPVVQKFQAFNKKTLQEKIYLHTDKNFYVAGELLWFKAYYVDGWFHEPLQVSKILYVDLLDKQNNPVLHTMISLRPGQDNGSLQLPLSLNSGRYQLRAYTNWMKNFGPEFFFHKQLLIVNPLKAGDSVSVPTKGSVSLDLLPEGGHLVRGLESRIGFAIHDAYGKGVDAEGFIISAAHDTVARFRPLKFGLGSFLFTPQPQLAYSALLFLSDGTVVKKELPSIDEQGYVMKLKDDGPDRLRITVVTNVAGYSELLLIAHTRQVLKVAIKARSNNGVTEFLVDKSKIGEGVSQFTVFSNEGQPLCERLYFKRPAENILIKTSGNRADYRSREKIEVQLDASLNNKNVPVQMSMAVFRNDSLQMENSMDIENYLWLGSDLAGYIEAPGFYFSDGADVGEATDNLMLVHGWRRFNWEGVLKNSQPAYLYPAEYNGHIINGRITEKASGRPAENVAAFLSVPFSPSVLFSNRSDNKGLVHFDVTNYYGAGEVVAQASEKSAAYRVDINSPYSDASAAHNLAPINLSARTKDMLEDYSIGMQTEHIYSSEQLNRYERPLFTDTLPFYGKPDRIYYLDAFTRFTTMEEVLREYVREINVFTRSGKLRMKMLNEEKREFYEDNMLVMLDGIPLADPDKILQLDPLKIRKVEIISRAYVYGPLIFAGIASFTSYKNNFEAVELDPSLIRVDYEGIQMNRVFYAPVYETAEQKASRKPDFRNTLFWTPDIKTDASGRAKISFYSTDQKGKYTAVIQGLDQSGHTAVSAFSFVVN